MLHVVYNAKTGMWLVKNELNRLVLATRYQGLAWEYVIDRHKL